MIESRDYQTDSAAKTVRYLLRKKDNPLIALPTGSGKTIVIADLIHRILKMRPNARIVVISHVKEILEQNYNTIIEFLGERNCLHPVGIFSAGLKRRECRQITIASIQSMFAAREFHSFDYAIVDEAHSIPPADGRYGKFRDHFKGRIVGLTATPYRLGSGYIYGPDRIFEELVIDYTQGDKFTDLIEKGYLCNLSIKKTNHTFDMAGIRTIGGEFDLKQASKKFDTSAITLDAIEELIKLGSKRKKWLLFAIDIDHAEHIAEMLISKGISAMAIHSKMEFNRDNMVQLCRDGQFRAIVNVNILTTGYDDKNIDLIGLLRPTGSPSLHVQMVGRGLRIAPGKKDCLVLDFAGNTVRLGPINDITVTERGKKGPGEAPVKVCPVCSEIVPAGVKVCPSCGNKFEFKSRLESSASVVEIIASGKPKWLKVRQVNYSIHRKLNSPDMLLVTYQTDMMKFKEWVCIGHKGFARLMAVKWMDLHCDKSYDTASEMMNDVVDFKKPNMIKVKRDGKYDRVIDYSL